MTQAHYQLLASKDELAPTEDVHHIATHDSGRSNAWRVFNVLVLAGIAATTGFLCGSHYQAVEKLTSTTAQMGSSRKCPSNLPLRASPPASVNPWAPLSPAAVQDVKTWLFDSGQELNLTDGRGAKDSDNTVFLIEMYPPTKDDVLSFLDGSDVKAKPAPGRYARVTIDHGGLEVPVTRDYVVGPLPTSKKTSIRRLTEIYHREDIPYNARGLLDFTQVFKALGNALSPMIDAVEDLLGGTLEGDRFTDTFVGGMSGGWSFDGSSRRAWISWQINGPGSWIQPINFYNYFDFSGSDPSQWKILNVVYHNQTFPSVTSFMDSYTNGTLVRFPRPVLPQANATWASRRRTGTPRDLDHLPGPRSVSFAGPRFRLNREQGYISWLGWGMYLSFDRDMGLSLWDIRFRGERIIYQLQPQECLVQYSGHDPVQSVTSWLDRFFGMGMLTRDLLPNYDCPQDAVFLPSALYHPVLGVVKRERAVCVFEMDTGRPLTRHFGEWKGETGAVKGYVLTVRSIASLGNYDYSRNSPTATQLAWFCIKWQVLHGQPHEDAHTNVRTCLQFDYIFHLDGTIEVKVSASGYLQGGYWNPEQEGHGSRIHRHSMGNVHDHIINFKVDLDIAGRNNTLRKASAGIERVRMPWLDDDDWTADFPGKGELLQQKIKYTHITNEDDARVRHSLNSRDSYAIVNRDEKNAWGSERGYAIHPGLSPIHNNIEKSQRLLNNANWASHHLAVSLRKDTEPSSSSMWNMNLPAAPPVNFDKFFDGEDIEQKDLVLWINVGTHHQPTAEDSPNTKTNIATSSFFLTPVNYFDSDPSMELLNAIILEPASTSSKPLTSEPLSKRNPISETHHAKAGAHLRGDYTYDDNGVEQHFHCAPEAPAPFSYQAQEGFSDEFGDGQSGGDAGSWVRMFNPFVVCFGG